MNRLLSLVALIAALGMPSALAGDAEAGKSKAMICAACHGPEGMSSNSEWPNLAGQNYGYLVSQTKAFRDGGRQNALMAPMIANLNDQDIEDIAAYYSAMPVKQPANPAPDAIGRNEVANCIPCHGTLGITVSPEWPNLAGQQETYLVNQLKAFRDGTRVDPVMSQMAKPLNDQKISDIAKYYHNLK